jgi:PKD repeat protein
MKKLALIFSAFISTAAISQMTMAGAATQLGGCDCYQLTPASIAQKGAIWSPQPLDLANDFDMSFEVYLGAVDGGADGMTFVLQENPDGIGDIGHSLGYESYVGNPNPISNQSLAVEIDTWNSAPNVATDIADDHLGISTNGIVEHDVAPPNIIDGGNVEDGQYHTFRVQWIQALNTFVVYFDGVTEITLLGQDIPDLYFSGNESLYYGFTAGTGGAVNEMRVCSYGNSSFTNDLSSVCPGSPIAFTGSGNSDTGFINSWSWDFGDGSPLSTDQNPNYTYTTPGDYTAELTMTDGFGCDYVNTTSITILPDITMDMDSSGVSCFGDTDGTGMATPTNGTGPYVYSWNDTPVQTTQTATALAPGTYVVTVTDDLGCVGEDSIVVDEPLDIMLAMSGTDVICYQDSSGTATVVASDGTPAYTYAWDDYLSQTTSTASNLPAGTYNVTVTDDNGCTKMDMVTVVDGPQIIITGVTTTDNGTGNGSIDITVTGGVAPYTYAWDNGETTEDISGLTDGFYTVTVTDDNGCTERFTFDVKSSASIGGFAEAGFTIYPNPSNGIFNIKGSGDYDIRILDLSGKTVYAGNHSENSEISIENIQTGVYLINLTKGDDTYIDKLIIR